ncbi:MAG: hypothetical protein IJF61_06875 [Clostridia bacterium]|nr:hypothetical protein [Clostridia bacterium]
MRQKKGRAGLSERVDYGVSSTKALCVIWTAKGCEEIHRRKTRVRSREYDGTLLSAQLLL